MIGVCLEQDPETLRQLLDAALLLMSKYAKELNLKDQGGRREYRSIEEWKRDASL